MAIPTISRRAGCASPGAKWRRPPAAAAPPRMRPSAGWARGRRWGAPTPRAPRLPPKPRVAARRAIAALTGRPPAAGRMPVVLSSSAGGTMVHEAVGHGLEADLAADGLSIYEGRIGETIASPLVTVYDDATLPGKRGSFA